MCCVCVCVAEKGLLTGLKNGCLVKKKKKIRIMFSICFSFCVCFKEGCEGVCRWLNLTLYNSLGTAQLLLSVLRGAVVETDSFCCVFAGFFSFENVKKFGLKC